MSTRHFAPFALLLACTSSFAAEARVSLNAAELKAATVLLHVENNKVSVNGTQAVFTPAPASKRLGFEPRVIPIPLDRLAGFAGAKANDIQSNDVRIELRPNSLHLVIGFEDKGVEVSSLVGSADMTGISASIDLVPTDTRSGRRVLFPSTTEFNAKINTSGFLLGGGLVKQQILDTGNQVLATESRSIFNSPRVQDGMEEAFLIWAGFATGETWERVRAGSLQIKGGELSFTVEK